MIELLQRVYNWMTTNAAPDDEEAIAILTALEESMEALRQATPDSVPEPKAQGPGTKVPSPSDLGPRSLVRTGTLKSPLDSRELFIQVMARVKLHEGWGKKDYASAIQTRAEIVATSKEVAARNDALLDIAAFALSMIHSDAANAAIN